MSPALSLHGIRVLVVDDDSDGRWALATLLTTLGAIVTEEASADDALTTLTRERPDVLLSDVTMPGHDGLWLIAQVRRLPSNQGGETPAAVITGNVTPEDRAIVLKAGFQYHIPKPYDPRHLAGIVALLALKP